MKFAVYGVSCKLCELHLRYPDFQMKKLTSILDSLHTSHLLLLVVIVVVIASVEATNQYGERSKRRPE